MYKRSVLAFSNLQAYIKHSTYEGICKEIVPSFLMIVQVASPSL